MNAIAEDRFDRREAAIRQAYKGGFGSTREWYAYADAAEIAFRSAQSVMASTDRKSRRQMRRRRRELIESALVANGVPGWVRTLVRLGQWVSVVLPAPFNVIVPAVLWMVDEMIDAVEGKRPSGII